MIKIKRVYDKAEGSDGFRILVDRLCPRGLSRENARINLWMSEIAPSNELRKWFSHDHEKWEEFKKRYKTELEDKTELLDTILNIEKREGTITLVYSARDDKHNNALALMGVLKERREKAFRKKFMSEKFGLFNFLRLY